MSSLDQDQDETILAVVARLPVHCTLLHTHVEHQKTRTNVQLPHLWKLSTTSSKLPWR